jgi:hypothetical protein
MIRVGKRRSLCVECGEEAKRESQDLNLRQDNRGNKPEEEVADDGAVDTRNK